MIDKFNCMWKFLLCSSGRINQRGGNSFNVALLLLCCLYVMFSCNKGLSDEQIAVGKVIAEIRSDEDIERIYENGGYITWVVAQGTNEVIVKVIISCPEDSDFIIDNKHLSERINDMLLSINGENCHSVIIGRRPQHKKR